MTTKDVVAEYQKWGSIRETARRLGVSHGVVRKCLVTHGLLETPLTQAVAELVNAGVPQKEVAEQLGLSTSWVNINTPYERGMMITPSQSVNAKRIRECRKKKLLQAVAENKGGST